MSSDKKTILVVDDEKDILEAIVDALTTVPGRKVITANSPSEAYMRSVGTKFDLMITDFRMPKTSGPDLVKVIRGQKQNASVPILLISGYPDEAAIKLKDVTDVQVMSKPFMINDLLKKVDEILYSSKEVPKASSN